MSYSSLTKRINIFFSIDRNKMESYFNPHDPAPLYKRQLHPDFIHYMDLSVSGYRKHSRIMYKLTCKDEDKELVEPFMNAIRKHFRLKEKIKRSEFKRFKTKAYKLLITSTLVVMACQGLVPVLLGEEHRIHSAFSNSLDVFSWVLLWKPIERLIFYWNPFLKEISLYNKLANADVIVIKQADLIKTIESQDKMMIRA
jgi:hypothetical protein